MASTLKYSESERLEHVLDGWPRWPSSGATRPHVIKRLSGGLSNASYLIECNQTRLVLRLNRSHSDFLGVQRDREKYFLNALAPLAFTPSLIYHDGEYDAFVLSYFEGRACMASELESAALTIKLNDLIDQYQTFLSAITNKAPENIAINYTSHLNRYWQNINDDAFKANHAEPWAEFIAALNEYEKANPQRALCHHDLNPDNIVITPDGPCIIDWEYAALGFKNFDKQFLIWQQAKVASNSATISGAIPKLADEHDAFLKCLFGWLELLWFKLSQQ